MRMIRLERLKNLRGTQRFLLITLSSFANKDGECWPSQKHLAEIMGTTRMMVSKNLKVLEDKGYITSVKRDRADGGNTSKLYRINITPVVEIPEKEKVVSFLSHKTLKEKMNDRSWDDGLEIPIDI